MVNYQILIKQKLKKLKHSTAKYGSNICNDLLKDST